MITIIIQSSCLGGQEVGRTIGKLNKAGVLCWVHDEYKDAIKTNLQ